MSDAPLPVDRIVPELRAVLTDHAAAVVVAAPGAGKSTRIPLALRDAPWLRGGIVMLEPRRLAARAVAARMAATLGEAVGGTVGYRVRLDSKVSAATRIEVVTEGLFTRRLQADPALADVGLVIFDEFHERSLEADLALALVLDAQRALRPDLKLLAMSATLDDRAVASLLGAPGAPAPVLNVPHRPFPVETRYAAKPPGDRIDREMAAAVRRALADEAGSILAFLPGEAEIRRTQAALENVALPPDVFVAPLYGALGLDAQARAVAPARSGRKVVLATTIAETSLTIEGVRVVVDGGLKRVPRFDPRRGMTELATVRVSRAAAEQRRGRAGRLGPGVCYRLWTEPEDRGLVPFDAPEILQADLAGLALDLAAWGVADPATLSWMTPPPAAAFAQAVDLLERLGAVDASGRITAEGKTMAALPLHPRLAHMVHLSAERGAGGSACDLAALLSERDVLAGTRDPDLRTRLAALAGGRDGNDPTAVHRGALARVRAAARQIRRLAGVRGAEAGPAEAGTAEAGTAEPGRLLALAYPDRVAQRRGDGRFRLAGGGGARLDPAEPLAAEEFLAVADLDGAARDARIFLAAPLARADIEDLFADQIVTAEEVAWDAREGAVQARRQRRFGALVLEERPLADADPDRVRAALGEGIRQLGLAALPWDRNASVLRQRLAFLHATFPENGWPDVSDAALRDTLDTWLGPYLSGLRRRDQLDRVDLTAALRALLPWELASKLDALAPTHLAVPSGSHIAVDYGSEGGPSLHVKLQEMFGQVTPPTVAGGRVPVTLHLLSPAQRPVAVTRDLASFWRNVYPQVRGEMRSRYPRHIWPEDPLVAPAVRRTLQPRKR
jgi:ATP-dependent helicase HrpB